jgi:hypothetical protein
MTIQTGASLNTFAFGNRPESVEIPTVQSRTPTSSDWNYPIGKRWIDKLGGQAYFLSSVTSSAGVNTANWVFSGGASGTVTLVGGTATVTTPYVTARSQIVLSRQSIGATGAAALGMLTVGTITAGTSFVINAVQTASATSLQASDVSVIYWQLIN